MKKQSCSVDVSDAGSGMHELTNWRGPDILEEGLKVTGAKTDGGRVQFCSTGQFFED